MRQKRAARRGFWCKAVSSIARKLAGVFLVKHLEQVNAPRMAVEEIRQQFRELYPGMFPRKGH